MRRNGLIDKSVNNRTKKELVNAILQEENEEKVIDKIYKRKIISYEELENFLKTDFLFGVITSRSKTPFARSRIIQIEVKQL